jgi:hypothetical protein
MNPPQPEEEGSRVWDVDQLSTSKARELAERLVQVHGPAILPRDSGDGASAIQEALDTPITPEERRRLLERVPIQFRSLITLEQLRRLKLEERPADNETKSSDADRPVRVDQSAAAAADAWGEVFTIPLKPMRRSLRKFFIAHFKYQRAADFNANTAFEAAGYKAGQEAGEEDELTRMRDLLLRSITDRLGSPEDHLAQIRHELRSVKQ